MVGVGQEIVDERGQESPDQIHSFDPVDFILPGRIQTLAVTTAHQNSR